MHWRVKLLQLRPIGKCYRKNDSDAEAAAAAVTKSGRIFTLIRLIMNKFFRNLLIDSLMPLKKPAILYIFLSCNHLFLP